MAVLAESSTSAQHTRLRKPIRNKPIKPSDPEAKTRLLTHSQSTPKSTISALLLSTFSNKNNRICSNEPNHLNNNNQKKKKKKVNSASFGGLGCGSSSSEVILSKKVRKKKQKKKMSKTETYKPNSQPVAVVEADICCGPGIGFASDATLVDCVESKRPVPHKGRAQVTRTNHRVRTCTARITTDLEHIPLNSVSSVDTTRSGSYTSNSRQHHQFRHPSRHGFSEVLMFQSDLLFEVGLDEYDQYGNWRLDVDHMSYEELLDLSEKIGYVGTGLEEDAILRCLRKTKHKIMDSLPSLFSIDKDGKCSICQDEYNEEDELGKLNCGHCYHAYCIKQWLLQKNACPVCKTAAKNN